MPQIAGPLQRLWATHDVRWHTPGTKRFQHHVAGDLTLAYEGLQLAADPGQTLITLTAAPGSPSAQALQFLASWAAAPQEVAAHDREVERGEPERWTTDAAPDAVGGPVIRILSR